MMHICTKGTDAERVTLARLPGCVDALTTTASDSPTEKLRVLSIICLQSLAHMKENRELMIEHPELVDALARRARDRVGWHAVDVAKESFEALRWLATPDESRKIRIFEHTGVMEALLEALKNENVCEIHECCLLLLDELLLEKENAKRVPQLYPEIVDVSVKLLTDERQTDVVKTICLGHIVALCAPIENNEYMFGREDVVDVLLTEWPNIKIRHYALFALNLLSKSEANRRKMAESPEVARAVCAFATDLSRDEDSEIGSIISMAISHLQSVAVPKSE